jgi:hypothetical protein
VAPIVVGNARLADRPWAQADAFGAGATALLGSMLVPASAVVAGPIEPIAPLLWISGVTSGMSAPSVACVAEAQTASDTVPTGTLWDTVPVELPTFRLDVPKGDTPPIVAVAVDKIGIAGGAGTGAAPTDGCGSAGGSGSCGAGIVVPGKSVRNDVAGRTDKVKYCAAWVDDVEVAGAA